MRKSTLLSSIGFTMLAFAAVNCGSSGRAQPVTNSSNDNPSDAEPAVAAAATQPGNPPTTGPRKASVAYGVPAIAQVTDVLNRVHGRLDALPLRIVVRQTRKEVTDLSKPMAGLATDPGPEGKFHQLAYGMGVVHSGMLNAAEATGDPRFSQYTARTFQFFADRLPALSTWPTRPAEPPSTTPASTGPARVLNPLRALLTPGSLDDCGAMATAMIKARLSGVGPDLKMVIDRDVDYVHTRQFRLADGTLARKFPVADSVWADDMYMGVCVLAQAGKMTGDVAYFDDAAKQVLQITKRLYVPEKHLFTHGWNSKNADFHPKYFWGRANGWCMMAMAELLSVLPEDHADRPAVLDAFRRLAEGVATVQAGDGLWHQMLDRTDSYTETSASAMFTFALARGVDRGWLDAPSYGPVALAGWNGVAARVDASGRIFGTCVGTNYANDYVYYYARPSTDDIHSYGPVLLAGSEIIRLQGNPRFRGRGTSLSNPATFSVRR